MSIDVTVKGKNIEVTEGLKGYAEKRLQKLEKYLPNLREAVVRESVERNLHRVEVTLQGDGVILRGEERSDNMYASVDLVLDKLELRIKKWKDRRSHEGHHDESLRTAEVHTDVPYEGILPAGSEPEEERPYIARVKAVTMKPMSAEEAATRLEWVDHPFFVYLDASTDQVHVIYRRNDGNFGLIVPKQ
ncbi:MAG: ribosome-associated translation inhibitor RaiA [Capsulimonadaceae bacterium]|nr:ribosome-associated translation inhibitor RaiA [Capsulimonadaceae bacterium]